MLYLLTLYFGINIGILLIVKDDLDYFKTPKLYSYVTILLGGLIIYLLEDNA